MRRALILDCDGVLADTELEGHLVAFNRAFEQFQLPFRWSVDEYGALLRVGGGKERMRAYLDAHPDIAIDSDGAELIARLHERKSQIYVQLVESGALPGRPGVARLVGEALDRGWIVACASTSAQRSVESVLTSVVGEPVRGRMAGVFAGDLVPAKKPAPDIYLLALSRLGVDAHDVVVIEDSQSGAAAAAAAGIAHLVTVSQYTHDDAFPDAASIVDTLGDPDRESVLIAGIDARNEQGFVDVDGLERVLAAARQPETVGRPESHRS